MLGDIIITVLILAWVLQEAEARWGQVYKRFIKGNTCERKWRETQRGLEEPSDCDVVLTFVKERVKEGMACIVGLRRFCQGLWRVREPKSPTKKVPCLLSAPTILNHWPAEAPGPHGFGAKDSRAQQLGPSVSCIPTPCSWRSEPSIFIATKTLLLKTAVDTCSGSS